MNRTSFTIVLACAVAAAFCNHARAETSTKPWLDGSGLLPPRHNPARVPPATAPGTTDDAAMVPAVPLAALTQEAILLFDAGSQSNRHYDLVTCLDGLTFGFGNWPQAEIGAFFSALMMDAAAKAAVIRRFAEAFEADPAAWAAFRRSASLTQSGATQDAVETGIMRLLVSAPKKNSPVRANTDGTCRAQAPVSGAFYQTHRAWLLPAVRRAFRDPDVVAFQVRYWEQDVITPAIKHQQLLGLPADGILLMAFYESNPGQVPTLQAALKKKHAPQTLRAGGQSWQWNAPPSHLGSVTIEDWHKLLVWQAMCPSSTNKFRIRSRNIAYFSKYLSHQFILPRERKSNQTTVPDAGSPENCNPSLVKMRKTS
ncbi:hypothetical protein [Methylobacterium frigidaeris]|uniref:Uncharacterized protein n=2 Tax=Methylobacterium frigidaeris TaxID=2038277 RepID=A0AA37HCY2_9HYPH|nr:hypothetical protein [Methylobacterium frigidaeris]GJD63494.1 hypothetical protein MPEAHAMD_3662 [Methylobacterium frigidaeris]